MGPTTDLAPPEERRPSWTDDTVPWWELVDAETAGAHVQHLNSDSRRVGARGAQFALRASRIPILALSTKRAEPFAKAFAARAPIFVDRARNLAQTFACNASRADRATRQALESGWMTAHSAVLGEIRRIRRRLARLLVRIAAWVGGSDAFAVSVCHDNQPVIDDPDTEEIDLGSGT